MSKLQVKPQVGYTKSQSSTNPAMYPNTTVESIYWEKEHMTLEEALRNGGGGSSDVQTEMPEDGFAPNTFYNLGTITENTTFSMAEGEEGKANHYFWVFETGADVPEITWPEGIRLWKDNKAPVIAANHHYEISVYDGVGMYEVIEIEVPDPMLYQPLTFEALDDDTPVYFKYDNTVISEPESINYSLDGGETWLEAPANNSEPIATIDAGETIMFKGNIRFCDTEAEDFQGGPYYYLRLSYRSGKIYNRYRFYAYGNIMSVIGGDDFSSLKTLRPGEFYNFFQDERVQLKEGYNLVLPATTLASSCYNGMFFGCTFLTSAPALPATTLSEYCYKYMFYDCTNLSEVKCYAEDISATNALEDWLDGVADSGTFTKKAGVEWPTGASGIPEGWTVVEEGGDEPSPEPAGGGGGQIIVSTGDWSNIRHDGTNELTREECIELVGMNEDDFDRLFSDEDYFPDIKIVAEGVISIYKAFNKQFLTGDTPNKIMAWCVPYFNNAEYNGEMHSIAIEINTSGNYVVYGLGSTGPIIG